MKKNKINIILITVVGSIWLLVALKATGNLFSKEDAMVATNDSALPINNAQKKIVEDKLQLNYPDPFLGATHAPVKINTGNSSDKKINKKKIKEEKPIAKEIPPVKFFGLIRNTGTNKMVAIVSINNRETKMLPGESFNDVTLEKITRDSILVSWNKNKMYIHK